MYVSAADNDYVGVTGTFLGAPSQGVWSTAPQLLGAAKRIPGLVQQSAGTLDLYSMQIRASAFEGESVSVTDLLADLLALHGRVHDGRGRLGRSLLRSAHSHSTVAGAALSSTGAVSGSSLSITGAASVGLLSSATGITGSTHHQQHGQRRELHHGGRRVHGDTDGLGRSNRCAHGRHADHHRCGLRGPTGLREPGLHLHGHKRRSVDGQRGLRRRDKLGHGLRAAALRLQHAHRDQHLRLLGRPLPDEELGGLEQAADFQQQRGLRQRSSWSGTVGRTSASSS